MWDSLAQHGDEAWGLQSYITWAGERRVHWSPLQESTISAYIDSVEARGRSKFVGKNLIHAIKFFRYIFGAAVKVNEVLGPMLTGRVSSVL